MKRWQVEQILYLNDFTKRKLALPSQHNVALNTLNTQEKKENIALDSLRRFCNFFLNVL